MTGFAVQKTTDSVFVITKFLHLLTFSLLTAHALQSPEYSQEHNIFRNHVYMEVVVVT